MITIIVLPIIEIDNSRILDVAKSPKITNSRKSKHAKITRSTLFNIQGELTPLYLKEDITMLKQVHNINTGGQSLMCLVVTHVNSEGKQLSNTLPSNHETIYLRKLKLFQKQIFVGIN